MSEFSATWLALREPYDLRARNAAVVNAVVSAFANHPTLNVADLACGTGSTYLKVFFPGPFSGPVVETHYVVDVVAESPANPGCGYINAPVRFTVGSQPAGPLGSWKNYQLNQHNLAVLFRY